MTLPRYHNYCRHIYIILYMWGLSYHTGIYKCHVRKSSQHLVLVAWWSLLYFDLLHDLIQVTSFKYPATLLCPGY